MQVKPSKALQLFKVDNSIYMRKLLYLPINTKDYIHVLRSLR